MTLLASAPAWLTLFLFLALLLAALEDLWRLEIEDWLSGGVAAAALLAAALAWPGTAIWQNLLLSALVLGAGTLLFQRGWMGGGDVKLLAACALWFDLSAGGKMLVAVAIAGGLESLLIMVLRLIPWPETVLLRLPWLRRHGEIPYGVAIAMGMVWAGSALR